MSPTSPSDLLARPWLRHYPSGVPAKVELGGIRSIEDFVRACVDRHAARVALHQSGVDLSFRQLGEMSARLAAYFQLDLHLRPGDRIALLLPNVLQFPLALLAALRAGLTVVCLDPDSEAADLARLFEDADPAAVIVFESCMGALQRVLARTRIETVIVAQGTDLQGSPRAMLARWFRPGRRAPAAGAAAVRGFRSVLRRRTQAEFTAAALTQDTVALLQYTAGTTSSARGAMLTHANLLATTLSLSAFWKPVLGEGVETQLLALPLHAAAGLVCGCLCALQIGARLILVSDPGDTPALVQAFVAQQPTMFGAHDSVYAALLDAAEFRDRSHARLQFSYAAGAATRPAIAQRWKSLTGNTILDTFGMSETAGVVLGTPVTREVLDGSSGVPLPSVEAEIRDREGKVLPPGEPGEIFVKGPGVMRGYYRRPEDTRRVLGQDGFLATGDIGNMSTSGLVRVVDRVQDLIQVAGVSVYPREVEEALVRHPAILDAAVIAAVDPRSGQAPLAYIVRRDPALTEGDVEIFARENLAPHKVPRQVIFVTELPRTSIGKLLRRVLRDRPAS